MLKLLKSTYPFCSNITSYSLYVESEAQIESIYGLIVMILMVLTFKKINTKTSVNAVLELMPSMDAYVKYSEDRCLQLLLSC